MSNTNNSNDSNNTSSSSSNSSSSNGSNNKSPEERFISNMKGMMDYCKELIQDAYESKKTTLNPALLTIASMFVSKQIADKGVKFPIENFIKKSSEHWKYIKERDEEYFVKNIHKMVDIIPKEQLNELCKLFMMKNKVGKYVIEDDDRDTLWEYVETLVRISINYVHINRKPMGTSGNGKSSFKYSVNFFPDVSLGAMASMFEIKLSI